MIETDERARAEDLERALAGRVSWGLPLAAVAGALGVGFGFGIGPAILVLAAGALVAVIGLLWASLRTLAGDAPLAEGLATAAAARGNPSHAGERKRRVLRALKDLELEHSVGKIDDEDYAEISGRYRDQAKEILREMDVEIEPLRPKAEALAQAYLAKKGIGQGRALEHTGSPSALPEVENGAEDSKGNRRHCASCDTSNEPDAAFCKKCRTRLARLPCPSCETSNEPDAMFCKRCGASLGGDEVPEAKNA